MIVRPGAVFGPGKPDLSGRVGINTFGFFMHLGGSNRLPLTFVDNCAEAIVLAGLTPGVEGEIFNVVDDEPPTSREFLAAYKKKMNGFFSVGVPYSLAYGMSAALGEVFQMVKRPAPAGLQPPSLFCRMEGQPLLESKTERPPRLDTARADG